MDDPVAELAAYFAAKQPVPGAELIRLTSAARSAGHIWASIAAACQVRRGQDTYRIVSLPSGRSPHNGAWVLYRATQHAMQHLDSHR